MTMFATTNDKGLSMRLFLFAIVFLGFAVPAYSSTYTTPPHVQKVERTFWEHDPFTLDGELYRAGFKRSWTGWSDHAVIIEKYDDAKEVFYKVGEMTWDNALGSVHVKDGELWVFGTTDTRNNGNSVKRRQVDTTTWAWAGAEINVYTAPSNVTLYNTSVTRGPDKWVIAYETDEPGAAAFSLRFLQSADFSTWTAQGGLFHSAFYSACPSINYVGGGWYIVTYMWNNGGTYETAIARTRDFVTLQTFQGNPSNGLTAYQQLLSPDGHEGQNNSDFAMTEYDGRVYMIYLTGDQSTWGGRGEAWFNGTLQQFYNTYWP